MKYLWTRISFEYEDTFKILQCGDYGKEGLLLFQHIIDVRRSIYPNAWNIFQKYDKIATGLISIYFNIVC